MDQFPPALPHGTIEEVFPDVFFVSGAMETVLQGMDWKFSRNMTVVRDGERLIIVNSVRLGEEGLAQLDKLGSAYCQDEAYCRTFSSPEELEQLIEALRKRFADSVR